jgi:2-polyprenyl-3-methyl-5-hydroxy-6-metoxy-1,4-benzoquinol methylase
MGATVTGIDAVEKNINIARLHAVCLVYKLTFDFLQQLFSIRILSI